MKAPEKFDDKILSWIFQNGLKHSKNEPFEWDYHPFLIDPMCDWSKYIAIRKSAQIGFTESFGVTKSTFACKYYGMNVIYTNTTNQASDTMVSTKVNTIMSNNPILKAGLKSDKLTEKQFESAFIFYRGTYSSETSDRKSMSDKAISISSDLNIYDERDRSDQDVIDMFASRLENSDYAAEWSFSNPSFPGIGTDRLYELSDQKIWHVTCSACKHEQQTQWIKVGEYESDEVPNHWLVDPVNEQYICGKCHEVITDIDRLKGKWKATKPESNISGYWMNQMNYVRHKAKDLLFKEKTKSKEFFYNMILGLPYRGTDITVDRSIVLSNINPMPNRKPTGKVGIGIDNGVYKHYVIGDRDGIFKIGKVKDWKVLEQFIQEYDCYVVIDPYPYTTIPYKLAERFKGKVYLAEYSKDKTRLEAVAWKKRKDRGIVDIQRTKYIDILVDKFAQEEKPINLNERELDEYINHWETLARVDKEDSMGVPRPKWESSNGMDHYAHATVYQDVALLKADNQTGHGMNFRKKERDTARMAVKIDENGMATIDMSDLIKDNKKNYDWRYL